MQRLGSLLKARATLLAVVMASCMLWRTAGQKVRVKLRDGAYYLLVNYRASETHRRAPKVFASTNAHWVSAGHLPRTWPTEEQALAHAAPFEEFVQRGFAGGAGGSRSLIVGDTPPPFDVAAASPIRRSKRSAEASAVTDVGHSVRVPTRVKELDFRLPHVRPLAIVAPCAEGGVHVHLRLFTGRTDTQLAVHQVHPAPTTPRPAPRHATPRPRPRHATFRPTAPRHISLRPRTRCGLSVGSSRKRGGWSGTSAFRPFSLVQFECSARVQPRLVI